MDIELYQTDKIYTNEILAIEAAKMRNFNTREFFDPFIVCYLNYKEKSKKRKIITCIEHCDNNEMIIPTSGCLWEFLEDPAFIARDGSGIIISGKHGKSYRYVLAPEPDQEPTATAAEPRDHTENEERGND